MIKRQRPGEALIYYLGSSNKNDKAYHEDTGTLMITHYLCGIFANKKCVSEGRGREREERGSQERWTEAELSSAPSVDNDDPAASPRYSNKNIAFLYHSHIVNLIKYFIDTIIIFN
ncbi:hypothetical protein O3G_MSEX005378 [Manduca sexta]|uniref:Uncharacterized protein n=1 Tax=Manduca sexta TaxID=7130 RepID=A0A921YZY8_MANSE|nr:hypothetical protein O3G_MSEX005378 [Manduca sexta]